MSLAAVAVGRAWLRRAREAERLVNSEPSPHHKMSAAPPGQGSPGRAGQGSPKRQRDEAVDAFCACVKRATKVESVEFSSPDKPYWKRHLRRAHFDRVLRTVVASRSATVCVEIKVRGKSPHSC